MPEGYGYAGSGNMKMGKKKEKKKMLFGENYQYGTSGKLATKAKKGGFGPKLDSVKQGAIELDLKTLMAKR